MNAAELLALSLKDEATSWPDVARILLQEGCSAEDTIAAVAPQIPDGLERCEMVAEISRLTGDAQGVLTGALGANVDLWLAGALGSYVFAQRVQQCDPAFQADNWSLLPGVLNADGFCVPGPLLNNVLLQTIRGPQASVQGIVAWLLMRSTAAGLRSALHLVRTRREAAFMLPAIVERYLAITASDWEYATSTPVAHALGKILADSAAPFAPDLLRQLVAGARIEENACNFLDQLVRRQGIESVGEFVGHPNPVPRQAANDLLKQHSDALPLLHRLAENGTPYQRMNAMQVLESREDLGTAIEGIITTLDMASSRELIRAVIAKDGSLELLERLAAHPVAHVRCSAAYHLGARQDGIHLLEQLLEDSRSAVRIRAAWSASQRADGEPLLRKALKDTAATVRRETVTAIRINWADAETLLQTTTGDGDLLLALMVNPVQADAPRTLEELAAMAANRNGDVRIQAAESLEYRTDGMEILVKLSQDKAKKVRRGLAEALVGRADGLGLLETLARDEDRFTRVAVAQTCGARQDAYAILDHLATDADSHVKSAVIHALAPYPEALEHLERFIADPSVYVRADVAHALAERPDGLPGLARLALDPDSHVRTSVVQALPGREDAGHLWDLLADDHEWLVRCRIVQASNGHPDPIRLLTGMANNTRWDESDDHDTLKDTIAVEAARRTDGTDLLARLMAQRNLWQQRKIIQEAILEDMGQAPREDALDILSRLALSPDANLVRAACQNAHKLPQGMDILRAVQSRGNWNGKAATNVRIAMAHGAFDLEGWLGFFEECFLKEPAPSPELAQRYILGDQETWTIHSYPEVWEARLVTLNRSHIAPIRAAAADLMAFLAV